jgi:hypothetical protein
MAGEISWADFKPAPDQDVSNLVAAITHVESGGNPDAVSTQGASGSMQIMPATFRQYAQPGEDYARDTDRRAAAVRKIVDDYIHFGGDVGKTAAAYIGGRGAVLADGSIRDDVADANGTTPAAYAQMVLGRISARPQVDWSQFTPVPDAGAGRGFTNPPAADPSAPLAQPAGTKYTAPELPLDAETSGPAELAQALQASPDAGAGRGFVNPPAAGEPMRDVGVLESLGRGAGRAGAVTAEVPSLLVAAGGVAYDKLKGLVTGNTETGAQDWIFRNLVDPMQQKVDWYALGPNDKQNFLGKVADSIGSTLMDLPLMIASGGTSESQQLAEHAPGLAKFLADVTGRGFDAMRPLMVKAGTEKAKQVLDAGGTTAQAVNSGTVAALWTGLTGAQPMSAAGSLARRVATGVPVGMVQEEAGRVIQNAADPEQLQQPFDVANMAAGGATNAVMAAGLGHAQPQAHGEVARDPVADLFGASTVEDAAQAAARLAEPEQQPARASQGAAADVATEMRAIRPEQPVELAQEEGDADVSEPADIPAVPAGGGGVGSADAGAGLGAGVGPDRAGGAAVDAAGLGRQAAAGAAPVADRGDTGAVGPVPPELQAARDTIGAVDAGGIPLNPAKLRAVAEGLGLEVSPEAKPEETIARIRAAVDRAAPAPETGSGAQPEQELEPAFRRGQQPLDEGGGAGGQPADTTAQGARPYTPQEVQQLQPDVDRLNRSLDPGMPPAEVYRGTPTADMLVGRNIARLFGVNVVFVEPHPDFYGVAQRGVAYVAPQTSHPAIAIIGHEVLHAFRQSRPQEAEALKEQIRQYLREDQVQQQLPRTGGDRFRAEEEVFADLHGSMWLDPKFWAQMRQNDPNTFRRIAYAFMQAVSYATRNVTKFRAENFVTDVDTVRTIIAHEMALQAREEGVADHALAGLSGAQASFSRKDDEGPFYSALVRGISTIPAKAQGGEGWVSQIKGLVDKGHVKRDEVEWSGLNDWLRAQPGKVSKNEVLDYLAHNGVQVREVTHEGLTEESRRDIDTHDQNLRAAESRFVNAIMEAGRHMDRTGASQVEVANALMALREDRPGDDEAINRAYKLLQRGAPAGYDLNTINDARDELQSMQRNLQLARERAKPETRYGDYTLPGGRNYREMLLTLPAKKESGTRFQVIGQGPYVPLRDTVTGKEVAHGTYGQMTEEALRRNAAESGAPAPYKSGHWDEPNILAHVRLNDRTDPDGKRVLFVEELQSDWAQEARKRGFLEHYKLEDVQPIPAGDPEAGDPQHFWSFRTPDNVFRISKSKFATEQEAREYIAREKPKNSVGVPRGPFVDSTDKWLPLALRRIVKLAADEGYDRVAFVNGEQSADRYDLSKQIDQVRYGKTKSGDYSIGYIANGAHSFTDAGIHSPDKLADVVGKEVADKIVNDPDGNGILRGLDLKVGGEGMRGFYDKIVPTALSKMLPKFGAQVGQVEVQHPVTDYERTARYVGPAHTYQDVARLYELSKRSGPSIYDNPLTGRHEQFAINRVANEQVLRRVLDLMRQGKTFQEAMAHPDVSYGAPELFGGRIERFEVPSDTLRHVGFDVTPQMREKTAEAVPMFSRKGATVATSGMPTTAPSSHWERAKAIVSDLIDEGLSRSGVYRLTSPMSEGSVRARAIAQNFANQERLARAQWQRISDLIGKRFTPDQRRQMWEAADEQNTLLQQGAPTAGRGLDRLTPGQRDVVEQLHTYGEELLRRAKNAGMFQGEGLPYWTPRMMVMIDGNGEYARPTEPGKKATSAGEGRNVFTTSGNLKQRKYLTAEETEAAMQAKGGELVRDIMTMPLAMQRLERAIAGRELINQIKDLGTATGTPTVTTGRPDHEGWFTLDHNAFTTFRPRFEQDPATGKMQPVLDSHGDIVFDRVPLYMSKEFEGPVKAILSGQDGPIYRGLMLLKSKAMSAIMFSPLIHNLVIFGRALGYDPSIAGTVGLYFKGHAALQDNELLRTAVEGGMVPMGYNRNGMIDITDVARGFGRDGGWLDPQESWIAHGARAIIGSVDKDAGEAAKRFVDRAGDIWHGTLLWNRVADLQMGIFAHAYERLQDKGFSPEAAKVLAAHWANRYAGAVAKENMSEVARKAANVMLFSRSFNMGNIGTIKDLVYGLPSGLRAKVMYELGPQNAAKVYTKARRKAWVGFVADTAFSIIALSAAQSAVDRLKKDKGWDEIFGGYVDRAQRMWAAMKQHPLTLNSYSPWQLSATHDNEPGKQDRVDMGEIPDQGGRHEYMRLPTGKVVEDLINWTTHFPSTFESKMSPLARAAWQVLSNDRGFGVPVYDPNGAAAQGALDVAKYLARAQTPWDTIVTAWDKLHGKSSAIENDKLVGNATGFSFSQGHPQGPEAGVAADVEQRIQAQKMLAMEDVKRLLKYGDEDAARQKLQDIGLSPREINTVIRHIEQPAQGMTRGQMKKFNQHSNEQDQERMDRVTQ